MDLEHGLTARELRYIDQGRLPYGVKKVVDVGKLNKERGVNQHVGRSTDHVERAMDRVTQRFSKWTESDLKKNNQQQKDMNMRIAQKVKENIFGVKWIDADKDYATVAFGDYQFRIYPDRLGYKVRRIDLNNVLDRKFEQCKDFNAMIKWIDKNALREAKKEDDMTLIEAKIIMRENGYILEDIDNSTSLSDDENARAEYIENVSEMIMDASKHILYRTKINVVNEIADVVAQKIKERWGDIR